MVDHGTRLLNGLTISLPHHPMTSLVSMQRRTGTRKPNLRVRDQETQMNQRLYGGWLEFGELPLDVARSRRYRFSKRNRYLVHAATALIGKEESCPDSRRVLL
jgi:hypothetical protein